MAAKKPVPKRKAAKRGGPQLTPKQERFVAEYLIDLNGTKAAIRAGYSAANADKIASQLMGKTGVQAAIDAGKQRQLDKLDITAEAVLRHTWGILTADPRELSEYRIGACRHCWGIGYRYQRTDAEFDLAKREHEALVRAFVPAKGKPRPGPFNPLGGAGFDLRRAPNEDCPNCGGEGIGRTVFKDTRKLSPAAAALFAGVRVTDKGVEIKTQSKDAAAERMFRHFGMFKDKLELTLPTVIVRDFTGKKGSSNG